MAKEITQKPRNSNNSVVAYFRIPLRLRRALDVEAEMAKRSPSNMLDVILTERYGDESGDSPRKLNGKQLAAPAVRKGKGK